MFVFPNDGSKRTSDILNVIRSGRRSTLNELVKEVVLKAYKILGVELIVLVGFDLKTCTTASAHTSLALTRLV